MVGLDGLEQGLRLLPAFEKIAEWILASATTLLGTRALAVVLFGGGDDRGVVGELLVDGGAATVPATGGEGDGECAGSGEGEEEVVGQPVGHNHRDKCKEPFRSPMTTRICVRCRTISRAYK